ncbi:hypothetical protein SAMN05444392_101655 [Seinonella peptonophila]|uniref:DUF5668 domain-containing protein n=1 Tax=Seinonella peptonophila TaxID=112248 RepID=A0A1M4TUY6_9BACL|nr:hypothetical protein [Seinonella peptonophila]SHE48225.1 hypothetical protein SAMN05444392_101655 [Seinonella peptonophila]
MPQKKFIGFFLVFFSALLLLYQTGKAPISSFITWPFILFFIASLLVFIGFIKENAQLVLIAGIAASVGLFIWGMQNIINWPTHWSILIVMFGIVIFLHYLVSKHHLAISVAIILILSGLCAWPGLRDVSVLAPIAPLLNTYWPVFILGLGIYFLFRK